MNFQAITSTRAIRQWIRAPYDWPGGYEIVAVSHENDLLCASCARENYAQLSREFRERSYGRLEFLTILFEGQHECTECSRSLAIYE